MTYPNEQPATPSWYLDHYLGDTRINVVAGLAGGDLLRDSFDTGTNPLLPGPIGVYELPMVVQDRQFNRMGRCCTRWRPRRRTGRGSASTSVT